MYKPLFENIDNKVNNLLDGENSVEIAYKSAVCILETEMLKHGDISIYLSEIWSNEKRKGHATELLNKLKNFSDKNNIPLCLRASIKNNIQSNQGLNQKQLVDWYIKNGFKIKL